MFNLTVLNLVPLGSRHLRRLRVLCCCYWVQDTRELSTRCTLAVTIRRFEIQADIILPWLCLERERTYCRSGAQTLRCQVDLQYCNTLTGLWWNRRITVKVEIPTLNYAFEIWGGGRWLERERRSSHEVDNLARQFQAWKMEITQAVNIFPQRGCAWQSTVSLLGRWVLRTSERCAA